MCVVLPEKPTLTGDYYAPVMPKWFTCILRLLSLFFALGILWIGVHDWKDIPVWARLILIVLIPSFLFASIHEKGWAILSSNPFFMADKNGMYFKHKFADVTEIGGHATTENQRRKAWLYVPWISISNIRLEKIYLAGEGAVKSAVLDIKNEGSAPIDEFFGKGLVSNNGTVTVVFYVNIPPLPSTIVSNLRELESKYKNSD